MGQARKSFDEQIAQLERVWDDFRSLKVGDLKPEDAVFHDLQDRFGTQRDQRWFGEEAFRWLLRLLGIESRAPSGYAEARVD